MPRITKVYTRTGDAGDTGLGGGQRVKKHSLRIEAYGTVDELNSVIGLARAGGLAPEVEQAAAKVQNELFHLGSELCVLEEDKQSLQVPRVEKRHVDALEAVIDRLNAQLGPLENFILPGGSLGAARLHVARTICRRAERCLSRLIEREPVGEWALAYLNRLSDALFVLARFENKYRGRDEIYWESRE